MSNQFDQIINRYGTDSLKYDFALRRGMPSDVLPMWVADMDFMTPEPVVKALVNRANHGIYGYSDSGEAYFESLKNWYMTRFDWAIDARWLVKTPGVVYAVATAVRAFTKEGEAVMIQEPVYYPFRESILINDRQLVVNNLILKKGRYEIDFEDFEEKIIKNQVKLFILCNPHNPVGRVFTEEELVRMGEILEAHDVLVVSDEIHQDFIYEGNKHLVFANLRETFAERTITCTAPSKTFNLAALQISNIFIKNRPLRHAFKKEMTRSGYSQPNVMGLVACQAAYDEGVVWLEGLKSYLKENLDYFRQYLIDNIPEARLIEPEGTYLVWVDFRGLAVFKNMSQKEMDDFMANKAKLWLDGGTMFGESGEGYQRFNIACPRATLVEGLSRLKKALES